MTKANRSKFCSTYSLAVVLVLGCAVGPALAASLKSLMGDMRDNTNSAKDVLTNFDTASANKIMERYAADARAASDMFTGQGGAKEKDLASRFKQLAAMANATSQAPMTKAGFRKALSDVTNECQSCHSAYN